MSRKASFKISRDEFHQMCVNHNLGASHTLPSVDDSTSAEEDFEELNAAYYELTPPEIEDTIFENVTETESAEEPTFETNKEPLTKNNAKKSKSLGAIRETASTEELICKTNSLSLELSASTSQEGFNNVVDLYNSLARKQSQSSSTSSNELIDEEVMSPLEQMLLDSIEYQRTIEKELLQFEAMDSQDDLMVQMKQLSSNVKQNSNEENPQISSSKHLNKAEIKELINEQMAQLSKEIKSSQDAFKAQMKQLSSNMKQNSNETQQKLSSSINLNNAEMKGHINEQVARIRNEMKASQDGLKDQIKKLSSDMKQKSNEIKQSIISSKTKNNGANLLNTAVHLLRNLTEKVELQGDILHCNGEIGESIQETCENNFPEIINMLLKVQCDIELCLEQSRSNLSDY